MGLPRSLRPYQTTIARLDGAREISAQLELLLLGLPVHAGTRLAKVTPGGTGPSAERLAPAAAAS